MATASTKSPDQTVQRFATVDVAKGLGITLVVIGHTIRGLDPATLPDVVLTIDSWIYAFHMPLFFLLSGLFIERSVSGGFSSMLGKKSATIVYPYLLWSVLQEVIRASTGSRPDPLSSVWTVLYEPVMQFWFLYVLFVGTVIFVGLRKVGLPLFALVGIAGLLYASKLLQIDLGDWSVVYLFRANFIFLVLGAVCTRYSATDRIGRASPAVAVLVAAIGFAIVTAATTFELPAVSDLPVALAGTAATLFAARLLSIGAGSNMIASLGRASFEIYVAHTIFSAFARVALERIAGITAAPIHLPVGIAIGIAGPLVLRWLAQRLDTPWVFRAPMLPARSAGADQAVERTVVAPDNVAPRELESSNSQPT